MNKLLSLFVCLGFVIGLGAIAGCSDTKTTDTKKTTTEKKTEEKKTEEKKAP